VIDCGILALQINNIDLHQDLRATSLETLIQMIDIRNGITFILEIATNIK